MSEPNTTELAKSDSETSRSMSDASDEALETAKEMPESEQDQNADTTDGEDTPKSSRPVSIFLEYLELFVTCLCTVMVLFSLFFRICSVSGHSMLPTLKHGELLLVSDLFYNPQPGDIIIFHQTSKEDSRFNEPIVKRVIATEGQRVYIDFTEGYVEVDDVRLHEDYIQLVNSLGAPIGEYTVFAEHNFRMEPQSDGQTHRIFEAIVPEGELFVMGDNRNNSSDSRTSVIGFVDERRILGKVLYRMSPDHGLTPVD
jgi:signal peptidase I